MSKSFRASTVRLALVGAVVVLGAGGTVAGVAAASPRVTGPPPVDHQLCYTASGPNFKIPVGRAADRPVQPERLRAGHRQPGGGALQPGGEDPADRAGFPDHEPERPPGMFQHQATVDPAHADRAGHQPVRHRDPHPWPAEPALRAVLEEPDRPAREEARHAAQAQPLHLLPGEAGPGHAPLQPAAGDAQGRVRHQGRRQGHGEPGSGGAVPAHGEDPGVRQGLPYHQSCDAPAVLPGDARRRSSRRSGTRTSSARPWCTSAPPTGCACRRRRRSSASRSAGDPGGRGSSPATRPGLKSGTPRAPGRTGHRTRWPRTGCPGRTPAGRRSCSCRRAAC